MSTEKNDLLDDAIAVWRRTTTEETLSESAKTALFSEVRALADGSDAAFVPSVTRAWRWAFLGSVPVVALATVLIMVGDRGRPTSAPQLTASKVQGRLVFTLANGNTQHLLYRSTDPQSFSRASAVKMAQNRYTEDATGGPALVFYRID